MGGETEQAVRADAVRPASRAGTEASARAAAGGGAGEAARRANAGPHAASLAGLQSVVARRGCADCEAVRRTMGGAAPAQRTARPGGLPDGLRAGLESLSGRDLSGVRVHLNSPRPAQLNAHAYAQGADIHVAPGQERHLPHEGWHAVQQLQSRVRPTMSLGGTPVNDDAGLEREAEVMGARALAAGGAAQLHTAGDGAPAGGTGGGGVAQRCARCGGAHGPGAAAALPDAVRREAGRLSRGPGPAQSARALDRAFSRLLREAGGGGAPPVQRAACGNDATEWYTGTRAAAAGRLAGATGMDISDDLAHVLCLERLRGQNVRLSSAR